MNFASLRVFASLRETKPIAKRQRRAKPQRPLSRFNFVVAHISRVAVLAIAAKGLRSFDRYKLIGAVANLIGDRANHSHACEFLERRGFAADDLQRSDSNALEIVNRAQAARPIRQPVRSRAAPVAIHVPDPFSIVGQVSPESRILPPRNPASATALEVRVHIRQIRAERADRVMMSRRAEPLFERTTIVEHEDFYLDFIASRIHDSFDLGNGQASRKHDATWPELKKESNRFGVQRSRDR